MAEAQDGLNNTQKEVVDSTQKILQRIQDKEKDMEVLQQEYENIGRSADSALVDIEKNFMDLFSLIEKRMYEVKQQIKNQQEFEQRRVRELQDKLQQEIMELKSKYFDSENLSENFASLKIKTLPASSRIFPCPLRYFDSLPAAVLSLTSKLRQTLSDDWTSISQTTPEVLLSKPKPQPKIRPEFLQYSRKLTLDPSTAHTMLSMSNSNRKVVFLSEHQVYPQHPDRFTHWPQVLSRESLTGRCYFEVEWAGAGVYIAVAYKTINRQGNSYQCLFGSNEKSWALYCTKQNNSFMYNGVKTRVKGHYSHRIGVYLDHTEGVLAFYAVLDRATLLHKVFVRFTEPLHAGLRLWANQSAAAFSQL